LQIAAARSDFLMDDPSCAVCWTASFSGHGTSAIAAKQGKGNRKARKKRKWRACTGRTRLEAVSLQSAFAFFACFAVPLPVA
jgi:hypothetical protein